MRWNTLIGSTDRRDVSFPLVRYTRKRVNIYLALCAPCDINWHTISLSLAAQKNARSQDKVIATGETFGF
jgi:hypothetical protein